MEKAPDYRGWGCRAGTGGLGQAGGQRGPSRSGDMEGRGLTSRPRAGVRFTEPDLGFPLRVGLRPPQPQGFTEMSSLLVSVKGCVSKSYLGMRRDSG